MGRAGGLSDDEHVLKTGWTPERAASFYGDISESKMRSMVAYARRHGFLKLRLIEKEYSGLS
jgi:hypothetical protein